MNVISGSYSTNAIVEVVDMNTGGVVATVSRFVRAGDGTVWENLTFELGVPDFNSLMVYQIRFGSSSVSSRSLGLVINRVKGHG